MYASRYSSISTGVRRGFTLIELLMVLSILIGLFSLAASSVSNLLPNANLESAAQIFQADLREQQIKAMTGYEAIIGGSSEYGLLIQPSSYVLFTGLEYVMGHEENYEIELAPGLEFTQVNLPQSSIVFDKIVGEVLNYSDFANSFVLTNTYTNQQVVFTINSQGMVETI